MKILIFYQYFGTPKGKWSTRMYELTKRWVQEGHIVTVVTAPYKKSDIRTKKFIERQIVEGVNLIVINSSDSNLDGIFKRVVKALVFSLISCYYALFEKADVVLSSSGPITVGLPSLLAKWFRGKPMVFEVRDLWPEGAIELGKMKSPILRKIALWFERLCYINSSLIVPCSKGMEEGVLRKSPNSKTVIIPNASDVKLFENLESSFQLPPEYKEKKIFLYAGSLGLMDEVEQAINGMALVDDPSIMLLIIGDGAERDYLINLVKNKNLSNVKFLGIMPKIEVIFWFSNAVATFVTFRDLPVLHTSSPNKMFDSFSAGVPIIQSTKGWIKELVEEYHCGINVNPDSPSDFAKAVNLMATNNIERDIMARNAKKLAMNKFNRDVLAKKYLEELKKVITV